MGIQPDFIVARSEKYLDQRRRDRFALFCNMHEEDIISNPDMNQPTKFQWFCTNKNSKKKSLKNLAYQCTRQNLTTGKNFGREFKQPKRKKVEVAIVGKYFGTGDYQLRDSYAALFDAIAHAGWATDTEIVTRWVAAEKVEVVVAKALAAKKEANVGVHEIIGDPDGIIVPIGWGERGAEGMIAAASYAREKKIPYLGLCYGMQLAVIGFARNILGWKDANTEENNKNGKHPVIHLMPAQKEFMEKRAYGGTMRLGKWDAIVKKGTMAWEAYAKYDPNQLTLKPD